MASGVLRVYVYMYVSDIVVLDCFILLYAVEAVVCVGIQRTVHTNSFYCILKQR